MCNGLNNGCNLCHQTLSSRPVNCGYGLAILGPRSLTIECAREGAEVIEETELCRECADNTNVEEPGSAWIEYMSWRRGGQEME
jgi:hypothetical protein